jgi:hypothetical protein
LAPMWFRPRNIGSQPTRTAFRRPWQNGVAERRVGSAAATCRARDHPEGAASQTAEVCILGLLPRGPDSSGTCEGHASGSAYSSSALEPKARFNPCRDSAACTIGMQRQRRVKSCCFSDDQTLSLVSCRGTVQDFCEDFRRSTNQPAIPSRRGCTE